MLGKLPIRYEARNLLMVHASPRRPVNEYLFTEDVYTNPTKIVANFERLDSQHKASVVGHTHVPGVFLDDPCFDPPGELGDPNRSDGRIKAAHEWAFGLLEIAVVARRQTVKNIEHLS